MSTTSIIIPTRNRHTLLRRAIGSIRSQTYTDWELIVVDDGSSPSAEPAVHEFHDSRISYVRHEQPRGGGAARNTGIRMARGSYVAFLDDDDQWVPEKLRVQMDAFTQAPDDVGFCFSAVTNEYDDHQEQSRVPDGIANYLAQALGNPKGFLTVTLVVRRPVFDVVGMFDERFPSHQETDLVIRMARRYRGLGINQSLVRVNMGSGYQRTGGVLERRIAGREMLIRKHLTDFQRYPRELAFHYFQLGLWYRALGDFRFARRYFWHAFQTFYTLRFAAHTVSMLGGGLLYRILHRVNS